MSLLETPKPVSPTIVEQKAKRLKNLPATQFEQLLRSWEDGIRQIWGNPAETAEILSLIGTDGKELFELSAKTAEFLEALKPGCTTKGYELLKPFKVEKNGTVSLT